MLSIWGYALFALIYVFVTDALKVALHAQSRASIHGWTAGSEVTTRGIAVALEAIPEVEVVKIFAPFVYDGITEYKWDLVILEGWIGSVPAFVRHVRANSPNVIILQYVLDEYPTLQSVLTVDTDGYITNSSLLQPWLSALITSSAQLKENFMFIDGKEHKIKPTKNSARLIHLAVNPVEFAPSTKYDKYAYPVVYLGQFKETKHNLLSMLREAIPFGLAIYGMGWDSAPSDLRVFWKGQLPEGHIQYLYSSALVVLGTTETEQRALGMVNNRVFEVLSCGAAFVTDSFPDLRKIIGNNGDTALHVMKHGDVTRHLQYLLGQNENIKYEERRKKLGNSGRSLILALHTWNHRITDILSLYKEIRMYPKPLRHRQPSLVLCLDTVDLKLNEVSKYRSSLDVLSELQTLRLYSFTKIHFDSRSNIDFDGNSRKMSLLKKRLAAFDIVVLPVCMTCTHNASDNNIKTHNTSDNNIKTVDFIDTILGRRAAAKKHTTRGERFDIGSYLPQGPTILLLLPSISAIDASRATKISLQQLVVKNNLHHLKEWQTPLHAVDALLCDKNEDISYWQSILASLNARPIPIFASQSHSKDIGANKDNYNTIEYSAQELAINISKIITHGGADASIQIVSPANDSFTLLPVTVSVSINSFATPFNGVWCLIENDIETNCMGDDKVSQVAKISTEGRVTIKVVLRPHFDYKVHLYSKPVSFTTISNSKKKNQSRDRLVTKKPEEIIDILVFHSGDLSLYCQNHLNRLIIETNPKPHENKSKILYTNITYRNIQGILSENILDAIKNDASKGPNINISKLGIEESNYRIIIGISNTGFRGAVDYVMSWIRKVERWKVPLLFWLESISNTETTPNHPWGDGVYTTLFIPHDSVSQKKMVSLVSNHHNIWDINDFVEGVLDSLPPLHTKQIRYMRQMRLGDKEDRKGNGHQMCVARNSKPLRKYDWSIGLLAGPSLSSLSEIPILSALQYSEQECKHFKNPIIHAGDITDRATLFVADPFLLRFPLLSEDDRRGSLYLFFEVMQLDMRGVIAVASSRDGISWSYEKVVLDEPKFHLSFPYVFFYDNAAWMIPESHEANEIRLYRSNLEVFPNEWMYQTSLLRGKNFQDNGIIQHNGNWYIFTTVGIYPHEWELEIFVSDNLSGPYVPHKQNPIVRGCANESPSRLGGRFLKLSNGSLLRMAQVSDPKYGAGVDAYIVKELTPFLYEEVLHTNVLRGGKSISGNTNDNEISWQNESMHHLDALQIGNNDTLAIKDMWIAVTDGANNGGGLSCQT